MGASFGVSSSREVLADMALMLTSQPDEPEFKFLRRPLRLKVSVAWLEF